MSLSYDMIYEIFSWLPAKSVSKFKSCSTFFYEYTADSHFAKKQAQNLLLKDDSCFFLQPNNSQQDSNHYKIEIHSLPGDELSSGVPKSSLKILRKKARILASSNGLLLCRTVKKKPVALFVYNPTTQSQCSVPTPQYLEQNPYDPINIVFECNSNEYKILLFETPKDIIHWSKSSYLDCKIYSSKEGLWKASKERIFPGQRNMRFDSHVYLNGSFHFITGCFSYLSKICPYYEPCILAYSHESGSSRILKLPEEEIIRDDFDKLINCKMGIYKWGKVSSICLVILIEMSVFSIWVLTDYSSCSWSRIMEVSLEEMGLREEDDDKFGVNGFTVMNGDSLVFATKRKVYRYGLSRERYRELEEICEHQFKWDFLCFIPYSNTLRPL